MSTNGSNGTKGTNPGSNPTSDPSGHTDRQMLVLIILDSLILTMLMGLVLYCFEWGYIIKSMMIPTILFFLVGVFVTLPKIFKKEIHRKIFNSVVIIVIIIIYIAHCWYDQKDYLNSQEKNEKLDTSVSKETFRQGKLKEEEKSKPSKELLMPPSTFPEEMVSIVIKTNDGKFGFGQVDLAVFPGVTRIEDRYCFNTLDGLQRVPVDQVESFFKMVTGGNMKGFFVTLKGAENADPLPVLSSDAYGSDINIRLITAAGPLNVKLDDISKIGFF